MARFLPCQVGSHLSRLRHLGWNQCSRGLTSRPLESCHHLCLSAICGVLVYPSGSAAELLDGVLKLRCCTTPFSQRFPTWSLPPVDQGRIRRLDIATDHSVGGDRVKRVRLTRKTQGSVICTQGRPEPVFGGKGRRGFSGWSVQPKGSVHWH